MGGGIEVETAISAFFAIGIAIGSLAAAVIAKGRIFLGPVPYAALGMGLFPARSRLDNRASATGRRRRWVRLFSVEYWLGLHIAADVIGLACAGGLFVVPLFAAIQFRAPADQRARVVGGVNISEFGLHGFGDGCDGSVAKPLDRLRRALFADGFGIFNCLVAAWVRTSS